MRKAAFVLSILLLTAATLATAAEKSTIRSNCNNPKAWAWVPAPGGELATSSAVATNGNRILIGEIACLIDGDFFLFGGFAADLDGMVLMQTGVFGDLCVVSYCTAGGSAKINLDLTTGTDDPTFDSFSGRVTPDQIPRGVVVEIDSSQMPEIGASLSRRAAAVRKQLRDSASE